ncbi:MAG TPA: bifunctional metallophosphatase/5'-nucleotidase, partial [Polyangiaceae bacterium]
LVHVKLLGINDFHGQLSAGRKVSNRPVGGAAVLASYLDASQRGIEDHTLIVHAGDHVGASPPASALLQDEPAIEFLNLLTNEHCSYELRMDPECNIVGTFGNHEFDEGRDELLRLVRGGNHAKGPFLQKPWRGAKFPYISANVVAKEGGRSLVPPYAIKEVAGVRLGFIGLVLKETPSIVTPTGVAGLSFLDEAETANYYAKRLQKMGVGTIVLLIHQGATQPSYTGPTALFDAATAPGAAAMPKGPIVDIIAKLDPAIDLVVSGHTHQFTNALVKNRAGNDVLVTQAFSYSTAFDDIDLAIERQSGKVVSKVARIVTTWADEGPGLSASPAIAKLVADAEKWVEPLVTQVIGSSASEITSSQNSAGESALGDLIADSQRVAVGADFAFMNPGGIRANLDSGAITWGELFAIQPFGNTVVRLTVTGQDIYDLLEQQWTQASPRVLQISGLEYTWKASNAVGSRVVEVRSKGSPIDKAADYSIAVNNFLATGGDNFTVLTRGRNQVGGPVDLDALITYVQSLPQPISVTTQSRIVRVE